MTERQVYVTMTGEIQDAKVMDGQGDNLSG